MSNVELFLARNISLVNVSCECDFILDYFYG